MDGPDEPSGPPPFWPIGLPKLSALLVTTFGVYQLVWFFHHWAHLRDVRSWSISPAFRAIFLPVVYVFPLSYHVGRASGLRVAGPVVGLVLAAAWLVLTLGCAAGGVPFPVAFLPLLAVVGLQLLANRANRLAAPAHDPNARLSRWNLAIVAVGGILVILVTLAWLAEWQ